MGIKGSKFGRGSKKGTLCTNDTNGVVGESHEATDAGASQPPLPDPTSQKSLASQAIVRDHYKIDQQVLGRGQYGEVFKAVHKQSKETFAIKRIIKHKVRRQHILRREMEFLLRANHPNIINVVDLIEDASRLWIVQEFCSGGELFDRIVNSQDGMTEHESARIVQQILAGIQHCHDELGVVHRDLKPENILFKTTDKDSECVIIDFGLAGELKPGSLTGKVKIDKTEGRSEMLKTTVGTPYYIAPEVFTKNYGRECDIWSIGVITYILLCGCPPYSGADEREIMMNVRSGGDVKFPAEQFSKVSPEAKNFISALMRRTPSERPSAADALKHPWFSRSGQQSLSLYKTIGPRMEIYNTMNQLKKMAAMVIVDRARNAEISELKKLFKDIDTDGSGTISVEELNTALHDRPAQPGFEFESFFEGLDMNNESTINYKEFLAASVKPSMRMQDANIKKAFDYFDVSNTGFISMQDMIAICEGDEDAARELIGEADFRKDHQIAFDEFRQMMITPDHKALLSENLLTSRKLAELASEWSKAEEETKSFSVKVLENAKNHIGFEINQVQLDDSQWTFITSVEPGSAADAAGLDELDVLLKLGNTPVGTMSADEMVGFIQSAVKTSECVELEVGTLPGHPEYARFRKKIRRRGSNKSLNSLPRASNSKDPSSKPLEHKGSFREQGFTVNSRRS